MDNILSRLHKFMSVCDLNNNKTTVQAGLSNGLLGNAFKSGKGLNSDSIEKILLAYTNLNAEWLLTGKGEMLKSIEKKMEQEDELTIRELLSIIKSQQETIKILSTKGSTAVVA